MSIKIRDDAYYRVKLYWEVKFFFQQGSAWFDLGQFACYIGRAAYIRCTDSWEKTSKFDFLSGN